MVGSGGDSTAFTVALSPAAGAGRTSAQLGDGASDCIVHDLPISAAVSQDGVPMQAQVRGLAPRFQDEGLYPMLLAKSKVGCVAEQIVHSGLPDARLNSLDGHCNASMKFLGRFEGKLIIIHDGAGRPLVTHR